MRVPGTEAIEAAELRHLRAVMGMRAASRRSVAAGRAALARPSTLALAALAGLVCGLRLMRRPAPAATTTTAAAVPAAGTLAVMMAFAFRYAMQRGATAFLSGLARKRTA